jgi:hypothetical protein
MVNLRYTAKLLKRLPKEFSDSGRKNSQQKQKPTLDTSVG